MAIQFLSPGLSMLKSKAFGMKNMFFNNKTSLFTPSKATF